MKLVTRQSKRSGHHRESFKRFIFSLLVYIAHSFLDDALYKFTYLLTYQYTQNPLQSNVLDD